MPGAQDDWIEGAKTIAAIVFLFLVVPIVILKARDRGYLKSALGWLSLVAVAGIGLSLVFRGSDAVWDWPQTMWVVVAFVLAALGVKWIREGGPGIEHVPPGFMCDEVKASAAKAKSALPWFVRQVGENVEGAFVKFPLQTVGGNLEHIWGYVHALKDDAFVVSLANTPFDTDEESVRRRTVKVSEIEDWQVMHPDGTITGAFSVLALFEHFEKTGKLTGRMRRQREHFKGAPA